MDTEIIVAMHTENDCYKAARKLVPKGIVVHSTGAANPNLSRYVDCPEKVGENKYGNHWNRSSAEMGRSVCPHAFVGLDKDGEMRVAQVLPYTYQNWLTGGKANQTHIGFEICEPYNLTDADYFERMWAVVVDYCAYLCTEFGLDPMGENVIIDHKTAHDLGWGNNHSDVSHWWPKHGKYLDELRREVKARMTGETSTPPVTEQPVTEQPAAEQPTSETLYRVQVGAYSQKANADAMQEKLKALGFETMIVATEKQAQAEPEGIEIGKGNWNVRTGAGTSYGIVGLAREGEVYQATGKAEGDWIGIVYGGEERWINRGGVKDK